MEFSPLPSFPTAPHKLVMYEWLVSTEGGMLQHRTLGAEHHAPHSSFPGLALPPVNSVQLSPPQSLASARRLGSPLCEHLSSTHPSRKQWPVFSTCQWKIFKSCFFTTLCRLALRLLSGLVLTCKLSTCGSRLELVCWHHLEGLLKQRVLASPTELQIL